MSQPRIGVYAIQNLITGRAYIGASVHLSDRIRQHRRALELGRHDHSSLQHDYDELGAESFGFVVVEEIGNSMELFAAESRWHSYIEEAGPDCLYNRVPPRDNAYWRSHKYPLS